MDKCGERAGSHRCDLAVDHYGPHYNQAAQHLWYPNQHWVDKPERDILAEREACASIAHAVTLTIARWRFVLEPAEAQEVADTVRRAVMRERE